jgi:N-alpha-acetyltransferase 35, NatC auxiliary subunit
MSAIEMMDPKMDAGMRCNREAAPLTFETAVAANKLKLADMEYSEIIGIVDSTLACLVSWLDGNSLVQTLYISLYLHKPFSIEDKYLRSFCISVHRLINAICNLITHSRVYEEEDFQWNKYDYKVCSDVTDLNAIKMLKAAEDELIKKSKMPETKADELQYVQAVINRLRFTRNLLQCLVALMPSKSLAPNESEMAEIVKMLNSCSELIPAIRKTIGLGTQPEPGSDSPNPMGFSPMVNQRLLPPTFPRYTKIRDRLSSINYLEELVQRVKLACKVLHCTTYHSALNFFMDLSKKSGSCLLSRSILQNIYFPALPVTNKVFGVIEMTDLLKESARSFISPQVLMPKSHIASLPAAKSCVDTFFFFNEQTFETFLEICGYNRARQREKLVRLLDSFSHLQDEAARVDAYLQSFAVKSEPSSFARQHLACFGTWILYFCLRAMSLYLLLGLELELYSVHEYLYIFWYLYEFLFGWVVSALTRADAFLLEQEYAAAATDPKRKNKLKKRKNKPYAREIMFNQAMQNMCGGYYKGLAGFTRINRIPHPLPMFDNEKVRFEHRFAAFSTLTTPPPMPYEEYSKMKAVLLKAPPEALFSAAAKHFHQARTILESIPNPDQETNDILRVAKVNFVVMNLLSLNGEKNKTSKVAPEFDFSHHRYFPVISCSEFGQK